MHSAMAMNPVAAPSRRGGHRRLRWLLLMVLGSAAWVVLFECDPLHKSFYPKCILHQTTGLYCPGCGATRATYQLLHGHPWIALRYNALYVLALPFVLWRLARGAYACWNPAAPPVRPLPVWASWTLFAVVLAFGVLRNLPFRPFCWLAPFSS